MSWSAPRKEQGACKESDNLAEPCISINGRQSLVSPSIAGGIPRLITSGAREGTESSPLPLPERCIHHRLPLLLLLLLLWREAGREVSLHFPTDRFQSMFLVGRSNEFLFVNMRIKVK